VWAAVSHGDIIKSLLADALGMHLDAFQRIVVDPCSVSVVRYTPLRPFALRVNDTGGDLSALVPPKHPRRRRTARTASSEAVVGGSTGTA
jgi:broad specificity phosphatase PhoE